MDGKKLEYKGGEAVKELERLTRKAGEVQEEILRKILAQNCGTEYLNKYMHVPGLDEGKAMYLYFVKAEMSTPCGPARTVLTSYYKSAHFKHRPHDPFNDFISPDAAILCYDSDQSMYCQLLAGLIHRQRVLRLGAVFASALLRAISFLERHWRDFAAISELGNSMTESPIQDAGPPCWILSDHPTRIWRRKSRIYAARRRRGRGSYVGCGPTPSILRRW
ncbi:UNVERIFIED_CONTAM: putative indole-3-acetic acid-amido synthetase GH3.9 [Sesamum radiatum]|uniref:Indole-3-acetic acid-amido synthetase GH3.9 n=1 Tax=Sesamum radiatum TaxID=300843 RepID=A0AAW2W3U2_SESRA